MELTEDPEVVETFPLGKADTAYNLHDLLSLEGFEVWVVHDESGAVELLVAQSCAVEVRTRIAALRSAHGPTFSALLPVDRSNPSRRRTLVMFYFGVGIVGWLGLAVMLEETLPSSEAAFISSLIVGLGAVFLLVFRRGRKPL